jgi:hypothetical protein
VAVGIDPSRAALQLATLSPSGERRREHRVPPGPAAAGRVIWRTEATKDGAAFVRFLDHLAAALPDGQVVAALDNVGDHNSHPVRRWWVAPATASARCGCRPTRPS